MKEGRPLPQPRRRHSRAEAIVLFAHAVAGLLFLSPAYIRPDSVGVASWLRSAVIDHDLLFFNEWQQFGMIVGGATMFKEVAVTGALANHWWIGFSILAAPPYLLAHLVSLGIQAPADGFFGLYGVTLGWTTVGAAAVAAVMTDRLLRRFVGDESPMRAFTLVAVAIGTPVFWYTFRFPIGTHVAALLFVALFLDRLTSAEEPTTSDMALAGLWLGLAAITRLQHLVLIVPAVWWLFAAGGRWKLNATVLGVCSGAVLIVQGAAWYAVYGDPLGPLVSGAALGGETYIPFQKVRLFPVLFSWYHGLFTWSPLFFVAVGGWVLAVRRSGPVRAFAILAMLSFGAEWAANGLMDRYFWGGFSFGGRRFLELAPLVAFGVAFLAQRVRPVISVIVVLLAVGWSVALMIAASGGSLELARPVTFAMIWQAVSSPGVPYLAGRPPVAVLVGGFLVTALAGAMICLLFQRRSRAVLILACYCFASAVTLFLLAEPTRARAEYEARQSGVDLTLSSQLGPLLDQRKLVSDERSYLLQVGLFEEAAESEREVQLIDEKLSTLREKSEARRAE